MTEHQATLALSSLMLLMEDLQSALHSCKCVIKLYSANL